MNPLPRISADEVLAAYRKTGLRPICEVYIDRKGDFLCGCPLGAIYVSKHPRAKNLPISDLYVKADEWADKVYGVQFTLAFTAAFDRGMEDADDVICPYSDPRSVDGWIDGRAAAQAIFGEPSEIVQ